MNEAPSDTLSEALARHAIDLPDDQIERLEHYCRVLWEWNAKLNLTRHTDYQKFVGRDVVDSLALERFLDASQRVLDIGTGGGVPGIVLAIVRPDLEVALCDSVAKKARAVQAIVTDLGLNVPVYHEPAQQVVNKRHFDVLVARAVAPLEKMIRWLAPYGEGFDQLLVVKGPAWVEERAKAREAGLLKDWELRKVAEYPLPGGDSQSVILALCAKQR